MTTATKNGGWQTKTLDELAVFSNGKSSPERTENAPIKVYGSNGVIGFADEANSPENTIVIGRVGSYCGSLYFSENESWVTDNAIRANVKDGNDPRFLWYLLHTLHLNARAGGSGQPLINQSLLNQIEVLVPDFPEQYSIAAVLSSLDNKIELLRKQNETLEEIAQTTFKEWFVNFNFPNEEGKPYRDSGGKMVNSELGEIPEGWGVAGLSDIADFLNGIAMQKYPPEAQGDTLPVIKIKELNSGVTEQTDRASRNIPDQYIIRNGDILFSWSGSLEVAIWKYGEGALNQHLFKVTSDKYPIWFVYQWLKYHLPFFRGIAANKATTMGHIQRHHLNDAKVLIPREEMLHKINGLMRGVMEKKIANDSHEQYLVKTRDVLLPKLMSGEVRVNM